MDKVGQMNSEQLQSLAVLALAMVPVALLWGIGSGCWTDAGTTSGRSVGFGACLTVEAVSLPCF